MSTLVAQTISNGTVSTSSANVIQGSAKAWVRFNASSGTPVINASYNVSSVTLVSGSGIWLITMTNALSDANYVITGTTGNANSTIYVFANSFSAAPTSSAFQVVTASLAGSGANLTYNSVAVFR